MDKRKTLALIIIVLTFFQSCTNNPLDVKLDNKEPSIEFVNVDLALSQTSNDNLATTIDSLDQLAGDLMFYELSQNVQANVEPSSYHLVSEFYNSEYISEMENEKAKLYPKLASHEGRINKAFQYLSHHFGDTLVPKSIIYVNKLFTMVGASDESISIGLENYISPESEIIKSIPTDQYHNWQRKRMDPQYIERDILLNWIQSQLFQSFDGKFAEHLIQAGKILYILNATFPKETEAYILRYSKEEYDWAAKHEEEIWNYLVQEQMLFQNDESARVNFLNEGPTTVGLAQDAPDRIGQYLGYKIVKGFMLKNKALSLSELIDIKYNNILQTYEIR